MLAKASLRAFKPPSRVQNVIDAAKMNRIGDLAIPFSSATYSPAGAALNESCATGDAGCNSSHLLALIISPIRLERDVAKG